MIIGALVTMVFFFAYTTIRTPAQIVGFSCAVNFCLVSRDLFAFELGNTNLYPTEHLLRLLVRVHTGSPTLSPSWHW
jgi:hypothetical protein